MKSVFKPLLLAGLLATLGFTALAQGMGPGASAPRGDMVGQGGPAPYHGARKVDPAKMQAWMAKRQAEIKAKLKLGAAQEGAWTTYVAAMTPPANAQEPRPTRADMEKLTTPERIDKMRGLHAQRDAERDKRAEATKVFYAALTPEQQKVFDTETARFHRDGSKRGPRAQEPKR